MNELEFIAITYEVREVTLDDMLALNGYYVIEDEFFEGDVADAMAYNSIYWDETGNIVYSELHLSLENYYLYEDEVIVALIIHELGHTFGLVDLYDYDFEDDSLMFYAESEIAPLFFTEFDIYNLALLYDEEVEATE